MKRFHVHVAVEDLAASIRFYSTLFGATPACCAPQRQVAKLEIRRGKAKACCG